MDPKIGEHLQECYDHVQVRTECIYFNSNSSTSSKLWSSFGFVMPGKRRL